MSCYHTICITKCKKLSRDLFYECDYIADKYSVKSMPTFISFVNGITLSAFTGADKSKLNDMIVELRTCM